MMWGYLGRSILVNGQAEFRAGVGAARLIVTLAFS